MGVKGGGRCGGRCDSPKYYKYPKRFEISIIIR